MLVGRPLSNAGAGLRLLFSQPSIGQIFILTLFNLFEQQADGVIFSYKFAPLLLRPILNFKPGDSRKALLVICDQVRCLTPGVSRNHQIHRTYHLTCCPKRSPDFPIMFCGFLLPGKYVEMVDKTINYWSIDLV